MKIAVTFNNDEVFQHFGHSKEFKMYNVEDGKIVSSEVVSTTGEGHGAIAQFLADNQVDTVICGGVGGCARTALEQSNIRLFGGVSGNADEAVEALLANNLSFDPNAKCSHHEHGEGHHHHHGESHSCSSCHSCH